MVAAHCARGNLEYVEVGRYNRANPLQQYDTIPVIKERVNLNFDPVKLDYDVMLLQLERPSNINADYIPINSVDSTPPVGATFLAMGWGETTQNGMDPNGTPILHEVNLTYVSNSVCGSKHNAVDDYRGKITDTMLCTFSLNADTCYGDSGGPILYVDPADPTNVMQVAIISWGANKCADGVFPGVNQRTSTSYDWIASWVCAIDGSSDAATAARYSCQPGQTFSPVPSAAPTSPTFSPAPTVYVVRLWIELIMDQWPQDISWNVFQDGGYYQLFLGGASLASSSLLFTDKSLQSVATHTITTPVRTPFPTVAHIPAPSKAPVRTPAPSSFPSPAPSKAPVRTPAPSSAPFRTPAQRTDPVPGPVASSFSLTAAPVVQRTSSAQPDATGSQTSVSETCASYGETCSSYKECCSQRCNLGVSQKSLLTSESRAGGDKVSLGRGFGGAAGGPENARAGGFRQLRRATLRGWEGQ